MRIPYAAGFKMSAIKLTDDVKQQLLAEPEPRLGWVQLNPPHRQDGHDFYWLVAPLKLTSEKELQQRGAGVLCETEPEMKETLDNLIERGKKHLVVVQGAGFGTLGWSTNLRRTRNEIGVIPTREKMWLAFDREVDLDTLETKIIQRKETDSQGEANFWKQKWSDEYSQKQKARLNSISENVTPSRPPHCRELTNVEIEELGKAKLKALQRQWPRCFQLFERQKAKPNSTISDQEMEDALALDRVAQGADLLAATEGKTIRPDTQLLSALQKAAHNYSRRGKGKIIDAAIYLIAFNWERGWCYLSNGDLAEKLGEILETPFTAEQVEKYRYRTLGLVSNHKSGSPTKSP